MAKLSLLDLVNQYIDDEKKRNKKMRSKSAIHQWIKGDANDELITIHEEFNLIIKNSDADARKIFTDAINSQFKTDYFRNFLLNTSKPTETYYKNLLKPCIINIDTIKDFLNPENNSSPNTKTVDFFTAFCKHQEREYGKRLPTPTPTPGNSPISDEIKTGIIQIPGAIIIDEAFITHIKDREFSMAEFYTSKQNENCQWYGVIQSWDVKRIFFENVKCLVRDVFKTARTYKVSFVLTGRGGSGKSTALRRLAYDLHNEEAFKIVWLVDNKVDDFLETGLNLIRENQSINFLVFIEDWYRMFDGAEPKKVKEFLKDTDAIKNIRFVIGDRDSRGKEYLNFLNNDIEPLKLSSSENEGIIEKIVENYPEWKLVSQKLFEESTNHDTSLFLLLFIIAYLDKERLETGSYDLSEPQTVFRSIILSDLKYIYGQYNGLAKALYYWGCIYAEHKIYITIETFLKITDYFGGNDEPSKLFKSWSLDDPTLDRVKTYLEKISNGEENSQSVLRFSHDTLADFGLSKLKTPRGWKEYGDALKILLLDIITEKGDDISASAFLRTMLLREEKIFVDTADKLLYIDRLLAKGNKDPKYIYALESLDLEEGLLEDYAEKLWKNKIYEHFSWDKYFRKIRNRQITYKHTAEILDVDSIKNYGEHFVLSTLKYTKDEYTKNKFFKEILFGRDSYTYLRILEYCLTNIKHETQLDFLFRIVKKKDWKLASRFFLKRTIYMENRAAFSDLLLSEVDRNDIDPHMFETYLEYSSPKKRKESADAMLKDKDWINNDRFLIPKLIKYASHDASELFLCQNYTKINNYFLVLYLKDAPKELAIKVLDRILPKIKRDRDRLPILADIGKIKESKECPTTEKKILAKTYWPFLENASEEKRDYFFVEMLKDKSWKTIEVDLLKKLFLNYATDNTKQKIADCIIENGFSYENKWFWAYASQDKRDKILQNLFSFDLSEIINDKIIRELVYKFANEDTKKKFANFAVMLKHVDSDYWLLKYASEKWVNAFFERLIDTKYQGITKFKKYEALQSHELCQKYTDKILEGGILENDYWLLIFASTRKLEIFFEKILKNRERTRKEVDLVEQYAPVKIKKKLCEVIIKEGTIIRWSGFLERCLRKFSQKEASHLADEILQTKKLTEIGLLLFERLLNYASTKVKDLALEKSAVAIIGNGERPRDFLNYFEFAEREHPELSLIVGKIISDYRNPNVILKIKYDDYLYLLKVDLSSDPLWRQEIDTILNDWKNQNRDVVTKALYHHKFRPKKVMQVCSEILENWEKEATLFSDMHRTYSPYNRYYDNLVAEHLYLSLCHPGLKSLSRKVAIEITKSIGIEIPEYINKVVVQILQYGIYPDAWKPLYKDGDLDL